MAVNILLGTDQNAMKAKTGGSVRYPHLHEWATISGLDSALTYDKTNRVATLKKNVTFTWSSGGRNSGSTFIEIPPGWTFDGNGFEISIMGTKYDSLNHYGLFRFYYFSNTNNFGWMKESEAPGGKFFRDPKNRITIKDLGLKTPLIRTGGIMASESGNFDMIDCYVRITGNWNNNSPKISSEGGGIIGTKAIDCTIKNCYVCEEVASTSPTWILNSGGGITGREAQGKIDIENCYVIFKSFFRSNFGGILGRFAGCGSGIRAGDIKVKQCRVICPGIDSSMKNSNVSSRGGLIVGERSGTNGVGAGTKNPNSTITVTDCEWLTLPTTGDNMWPTGWNKDQDTNKVLGFTKLTPDSTLVQSSNTNKDLPGQIDAFKKSPWVGYTAFDKTNKNFGKPELTATDRVYASKPTQPRNLIVEVDDRSAKLTWQAPSSDGGDPVNGYKIQHKKSGNWTDVSVGNVLTKTVTGLDNGTEYTFRVFAKNSVGTSDLSSNEVTGIPKYTTIPTQPRNLTIEVDNASAKLTWQAPSSDGDDPINGYKIQHKKSGNWVDVSVGNVLTKTITGLDNDNEYTFKIFAKNSVGTSNLSSNEAKGTPSIDAKEIAIAKAKGIITSSINKIRSKGRSLIPLVQGKVTIDSILKTDFQNMLKDSTIKSDLGGSPSLSQIKIRRREKRRAAFRLLFKQKESIKAFKIKKAELNLSKKVPDGDILVVKAGETVKLNDDSDSDVEIKSGKVSFYADLENNEKITVKIRRRSLVFTRSDFGNQERYSLTVNKLDAVKVNKIYGGNFLDSKNFGGFLVPGDVIIIDELNLVIGSVSGYVAPSVTDVNVVLAPGVPNCGCNNNYNVPSFPTTVGLGLSIATGTRNNAVLDNLMIAARRIENSPSLYATPGLTQPVYAGLPPRVTGIDAPPGPPVNQVNISFGENGAVSVSQNSSAAIENISLAHLQNGGPAYNYSNMRGSSISTTLQSSSGNFISEVLNQGSVPYGPASLGVTNKLGSFVDNSLPGLPNLAPTFDINGRAPVYQPSIPSEMKSVKSLTIKTPGTGYVTTSLVQTSSTRVIPNPIPPVVSPTLGGSGLSLSIVTVGGEIVEFQILNPGSGYQVGDLITVVGGGGNATLIVIELRSLSYRTSDCLILPSTHVFNESNPLFAVSGNSIFQ